MEQDGTGGGTGTGAGRAGPALDGLPREHRLVPTIPQRCLWGGAAALGLPLVVVAVQSGSWWLAGAASLAVLGNATRALLTRRTGTTLAEDGVRLHNGITRARLVRWEDVVGVTVRQRWEGASTLRRRGGRDVKLVGVPVEVARALAAALGPTPRAPQSGGRAPVAERVGRRGPPRPGRSQR